MDKYKKLASNTIVFAITYDMKLNFIIRSC